MPDFSKRLAAAAAGDKASIFSSVGGNIPTKHET